MEDLENNRGIIEYLDIDEVNVSKINNTFDFRTHLPIHLCYITELGIVISFILKNKTFYPVLALNSLGGGISGLTNSNLVVSSYWIEFFH